MNDTCNGETKMTTIQRIALNLMAEDNIGALLVKGYGYVFLCHIRASEEVAFAVVEKLSK